jgi:hypothetical protein
MTTASKTERQLIDSIRKAKTGTQPAAASEADRVAPESAPTPLAAASEPPAARPAPAAHAMERAGYLGARRVWPD